MSNQTGSSGYLSFSSTNYTDQTELSDIKLKVNNKEPTDEHIQDQNIYDRIYAFDDDQDLKRKHHQHQHENRNERRSLPGTPAAPSPYVVTVDKTFKRPYKCMFCIGGVVLLVILFGIVAVYLKISCFKDMLCEKEGQVSEEESQYKPHYCDNLVQQDYGVGGKAGCHIELTNAKALMLQSENTKSLTFDIDGKAEKNVTVNGMKVVIKINSTVLSIDILIEKVNCSTIGTHVVTVTNGTRNETYEFNVIVNPETQQCPCVKQEDVGEKRFITCEYIENVAKVTVEFREKTSNDVVTLAKDVLISDIVENDNRVPVPVDDAIFLAIVHMTFRLEFSSVKCSHAGTYVITLGNTVYETVFSVNSYPRKPVIGVDHGELGGLIEGQGGEVRCEASVGCGDKPNMWEYTSDGFQKVNSETSQPDTDGLTYYETVRMDPYDIHFNNTQFKCNYTHEDVNYESDIYTALVVPEVESQYQPHCCDNLVQQDYGVGGKAVCHLELTNAKALMLQSENTKSLTFDIDGKAEKNVTVNGMEVVIKINSTVLSIDILIEKVNCSTIGTHVVTVTNGTRNETYEVNVIVNPETQQCPCVKLEDVGKKRFITCEYIENVAKVTVEFREKTSNDVVTLAKDVLISDIVENDNRVPVPVDDAIFLAIVHMTFRLEFILVKCSHAGTYVITLGNTVYETVFSVNSYPRKPVIGVDHDQLGGLIEGHGGEVRCEASVGCGDKPNMWEYIFDGFQEVNSKTSQPDTDGLTYYETVRMDPYDIHFNNTQFKCNYTHEDVNYESDIYTALVVPENWCQTQHVDVGCHAKHPFYCHKWITCVTATKPIEQVCVEGFHYHFEHPGQCVGWCVSREEAKCTVGRK